MTIEKFTQDFADMVEHAVRHHFESDGTGIPETELTTRLATIGVLASSGTLGDLYQEKLVGKVERRKGVGWLPAGCPTGVGRFGSTLQGKVSHRDPATIPDEFIEDLKAVLTKGWEVRPKGLPTQWVTAKLDEKYPQVMSDPGFLSVAIMARMPDFATIGKGPTPIQRVVKHPEIKA